MNITHTIRKGKHRLKDGHTVAYVMLAAMLVLGIGAGIGGMAEAQTVETVDLEAPTFMPLNSTSTYTVLYTNESGTYDVTAQAAANSTEGLVLNKDKGEIYSTANASLEGSHNMAISYAGYYRTQTIDVYEPTIENIAEPLPFIWRFNALFSDDTMFGIILAVLAGVVGTRWSTSFGGLAFGTIGVVAAWVTGYMATGVMLVGVFMAVFIGLNVAANIDYSTIR